MEERPMRVAIRYLGFLVLIGAAVAVWVVLAPKVDTKSPTLPSGTDYGSLISQALSDATANNVSADTAPKQQVVNGWVARDLLTIVAKQNIDILKSQGAVVDATGNLSTTPFDDRIPALLLIGLLAICWTGLTAVPMERTVRQVEAVSPAVRAPADSSVPGETGGDVPAA
jgi:hypothetical protein